MNKKLIKKNLFPAGCLVHVIDESCRVSPWTVLVRLATTALLIDGVQQGSVLGPLKHFSHLPCENVHSGMSLNKKMHLN